MQLQKIFSPAASFRPGADTLTPLPTPLLKIPNSNPVYRALTNTIDQKNFVARGPILEV